MLLLFEPFDGGGGGGIDPPAGSSTGYGGFQVVPVAFFSLLLAIITKAVTRG